MSLRHARLTRPVCEPVQKIETISRPAGSRRVACAACRKRSAWSLSVFLPVRKHRGEVRPLGRIDAAGEDLASRSLARSPRIDAQRRRQFRDGRIHRTRALDPCARSGRALRPLRAISSRKVWSAAALIAVASARPIGDSGCAAPSSITSSVSFSSICDCVASSSTSKPAPTSASNGNWCSRLVQKAWMVCTFSPPGVSSASANSRRARVAQLRVGRHRRSCGSPVELGIVERGPGRQRVEHPRRHGRGGGLGEGDAENLRRVLAAQQQLDHALGQHMGLAGAGIGRGPGRDGGIGRLVLRLHDAIGQLGFAAVRVLMPEYPGRLRRRSADHSRTRAR